LVKFFFLIIISYLRIDKNLFIKLSDSALSRDIFPNDYHCLGDNENRPIMWLAFESICENNYTIESDIVSFNSILYEKESRFKPLFSF
jgi:RYK receptor-like tyrosine kinase